MGKINEDAVFIALAYLQIAAEKRISASLSVDYHADDGVDSDVRITLTIKDDDLYRSALLALAEKVVNDPNLIRIASA